MLRLKTAVVFIVFAGISSFISASSGDKSVKQLIFEEQRIEGKIRRPQLVLIKADQRPDFAPMVIQSLGKNTNVTDLVDESVIENSPYEEAFEFSGKEIKNYVP
ncbi:MAG: hypothetical protein GF401_18035 [Chitinivibrionales bacterium]|nr:hypothetical protein [Chitinivibrionales bacterium]